jgi:hypothetical protein
VNPPRQPILDRPKVSVWGALLKIEEFRSHGRLPLGAKTSMPSKSSFHRHDRNAKNVVRE